MPACEKEVKATNCDPSTRTVNTGAECGADDDWYYYSPWRAPGPIRLLSSPSTPPFSGAPPSSPGATLLSHRSRPCPGGS